MEAGIGLGLAFADFIIKYGKKFLKRNWGQFRVSCIDELYPRYEGSRDILIDFLSRKDAYERMKNLTNGSESDFKNLLKEFQDACSGTKHEFDPEDVIRDIKYGVEITEAETSFEKIVTRYLQKFSESNKKIDYIHQTVKKISDKQDQTNEKNMNESSKPFSAESATYSSYIEELKSKLEEIPEPEIKFNLTFTGDGVNRNSTEQLSSWIKSKRKVILKGAAGSGKSEIVLSLVKHLVNEKILPVLIQINVRDDVFKQLVGASARGYEAQMDILLKMSKGTITIERLKNFEGEVWLIIDGINEFAAGNFGELTEKTLQGVEEYIRQTFPKTHVLVTDRLTPRGSTSGWNQITLNALSEEEIRKNLDDKLGSGKYELSKPNQSLLSKPFFLNIALDRGSASLVSESAVLNDFFTKRLKLEDMEVTRLAKVAFNAYQKYRAVSFDLQDFEKQATKETCKKLLSGGAITKTSGTNARFDHQLMHDYLVSNYLASNKEEWEINSLDIASLESNSTEVIYLTLQQISDKELADKFLLGVYDWNWNAAITSIISNTELGIANHSEEIATAMLALVAQKQFDRIYGTSVSAKKSLADYDMTLAKQFAKARDLKELIKMISAIEPKSALFENWKKLFVMERELEISDETIKLITSDNSLIGWTASNVFRECSLNDKNQNDLRMILESSDSNNPKQNTRRWRIIHTLGRFPSEKNKKLLFNALESDVYHWVRYGAARALVEMAAVTDDETFRDSIMEKLGNVLIKLKKNVLEEIGKAAFYRDAHGSWDDDVIPLLEKIKDLKKDHTHMEEWNKTLANYKNGEWKN